MYQKSISLIFILLVILLSLTVGFIFGNILSHPNSKPTATLDSVAGEAKKEDTRCPDYEIPTEDKTYLDEHPPIQKMLNDKCELILRRQNLIVGTLPLEALFTSGIGCASCHAQTIYIVNGNSVLLVDDGTDIRVKVDGSYIVVKSQLTGGGAPSPGDLGIIKNYELDPNNSKLIKTSEYKEEYTLEDYGDK